MFASEKLRELVDSLVIPDRKSKAADVDSQATEKALLAILAGGRENVVGLVDLLVEPGKGDDSKARYAIHALAVRLAGQRDDKERRAYAQALASTLKSDRPRDARAFVARQLQVVGGQEVTADLGALLTDQELCEPAAQALLAIRAGAAEQFRQALPRVEGKARVTVAQALGVLRDTSSAEGLRKLLTDADRDTRLVAAWALANMGDAGSVEAILKASDGEGYERVKMSSVCLLLAERLQASGQKKEAAQVYKYLAETRKAADEKHVRDAAERALK